MKLSGWLLRVALIAMIAVSLVFTWLIWQNPSRLGHQEATVTTKRKEDPDVAKNAGIVFSPTTVYYQHENQKTWLFSPDDNVALNVRNAIHSWRLGSVTNGGKLTTSEYNALLSTNDSLQLLYSDQMAYQTFNAHFFTKKATATNADFTFNRLLLSLSGHSDQLVFINDANRTIHTGKLTHGQLAALQRLINKAAITGKSVTERRLANGRQIPIFTDNVALQPYVYLLDQQSANHYVSLLMPATAASSVDAREIGADTVYTAGTDYRLTLDTDTDVLQFDDTGTATPAKSLATNLNKAYAALGSLNLLGLNSMRYAHYHSATKTVTYRSYAQGLPIFNQDYYGRVTVANTSNGQQMFFSTNNLTVPIPTDQNATTLPPTQAVFDQLQASGYNADTIEDITLGYYWAKQDENSQVVNLTPTYFVEIGGKYRRYDQWPRLNAAAKKANTAPTAAQE
ncbi:YycH family regulatory protein [Lacticaseibacillus baoqingensis]|uniref:YycH family regulatory protein n=1 Tax=Lacticaseibacillus baoqingensis TaxID=2486013 RepID=A0ABW4E8Z6_9LACO|nr:two-component system activity regulator YycH [Lacticaseibacillus baoqingensis]